MLQNSWCSSYSSRLSSFYKPPFCYFWSKSQVTHGRFGLHTKSHTFHTCVLVHPHHTRFPGLVSVRIVLFYRAKNLLGEILLAECRQKKRDATNTQKPSGQFPDCVQIMLVKQKEKYPPYSNHVSLSDRGSVGYHKSTGTNWPRRVKKNPVVRKNKKSSPFSLFSHSLKDVAKCSPWRMFSSNNWGGQETKWETNVATAVTTAARWTMRQHWKWWPMPIYHLRSLPVVLWGCVCEGAVGPFGPPCLQCVQVGLPGACRRIWVACSELPRCSYIPNTSLHSCSFGLIRGDLVSYMNMYSLSWLTGLCHK